MDADVVESFFVGLNVVMNTYLVYRLAALDRTVKNGAGTDHHGAP